MTQKGFFTKVPYDLGYAEAICERCRLKMKDQFFDCPERQKILEFDVEEPPSRKAEKTPLLGTRKSKFE